MQNNNISHIKAGRQTVIGSELFKLRAEYGLEVDEAATAIGVPSSVFRCWEKAKIAEQGAPSLVHAENCFIAYSRRFKKLNGGKNLIFGQYPLHVARSLLQRDISTMAEAYGSSSTTWRKYECHERILPAATIHRIERDVREHFSRVCGNDPNGGSELGQIDISSVLIA